MTAVDLIAAERERQLSAEGYDPEHDSGHDTGDIARAAAMYALPESDRQQTILGRPLRLWFWPQGWEWRPGRAPYSHPERTNPIDQRIRELVKAGALIAAEIDRLERSRGTS